MQQVDKALQEDVEMKKLAKIEKSKIYCGFVINISITSIYQLTLDKYM